jgi:hypothetical protein
MNLHLPEPWGQPACNRSYVLRDQERIEETTLGTLGSSDYMLSINVGGRPIFMPQFPERQDAVTCYVYRVLLSDGTSCLMRAGSHVVAKKTASHAPIPDSRGTISIIFGEADRVDSSLSAATLKSMIGQPGSNRNHVVHCEFFDARYRDVAKLGRKIEKEHYADGVSYVIRKSYYRLPEILRFVGKALAIFPQTLIMLNYCDYDLAEIGHVSAGDTFLGFDVKERRWRDTEVLEITMEDYTGALVAAGNDYMPSLNVGTILCFSLTGNLRRMWNDTIGSNQATSEPVPGAASSAHYG